MKGVEGLPLKYLIILLVAIIALGIILEVTGIVKFSALYTAQRMNQTLINQTEQVLNIT